MVAKMKPIHRSSVQCSAQPFKPTMALPIFLQKPVTITWSLFVVSPHSFGSAVENQASRLNLMIQAMLARFSDSIAFSIEAMVETKRRYCRGPSWQARISRPRRTDGQWVGPMSRSTHACICEHSRASGRCDQEVVTDRSSALTGGSAVDPSKRNRPLWRDKGLDPTSGAYHNRQAKSQKASSSASASSSTPCTQPSDCISPSHAGLHACPKPLSAGMTFHLGLLTVIDDIVTRTSYSY